MACIGPVTSGALLLGDGGFCAVTIPTYGIASARSIVSLTYDTFLTLDRGSGSIKLSSKSVSVPNITPGGWVTKTLINGTSSSYGLNHGLAMHDNYLYASSDNSVYRWPFSSSKFEVIGDVQEVITGINNNGDGSDSAGQHKTRTLVFDEDGMLYVSVGSARNVDANSYRSRIRRFALEPPYPIDFEDGTVFADGLRNTVAMAFDGDGVLWGVDNGADNLVREDLGSDIGQDNPADELNRFDKTKSIGSHFGYPYCFAEYNFTTSYSNIGNGTQWAWPTFLQDSTISDKDCRDNYTRPVVALQGHSAVLGITFYKYRSQRPEVCDGIEPFPSTMDGYAFLAYHGSSNRDVPTGYKVAYVPDLTKRDTWNITSSNYLFPRPVDLLVSNTYQTNATWVKGFRPVDVKFDECGRLLVSSDGTVVDKAKGTIIGSQIIRIQRTVPVPIEPPVSLITTPQPTLQQPQPPQPPQPPMYRSPTLSLRPRPVPTSIPTLQPKQPQYLSPTLSTRPRPEPASSPITRLPSLVNIETPAPVTLAPLSSPLTLSPLLVPVTSSPLLAPFTSSPLLAPITASPLTARPVIASPLARPVTASPLTARPVPASPLTARPVPASPLARPVPASPLARPGTASPLARPGTASPLARPVTASPLARPGTASPLARPGTASPLATGPVTASPLAAGPVTASPLATGPVAASPLATGPVTASPLAAGPVAASPLVMSPLTVPVPTPLITSPSLSLAPVLPTTVVAPTLIQRSVAPFGSIFSPSLLIPTNTPLFTTLRPELETTFEPTMLYTTDMVGTKIPVTVPSANEPSLRTTLSPDSSGTSLIPSTGGVALSSDSPSGSGSTDTITISDAPTLTTNDSDLPSTNESDMPSNMISDITSDGPSSDGESLIPTVSSSNSATMTTIDTILTRSPTVSSPSSISSPSHDAGPSHGQIPTITIITSAPITTVTPPITTETPPVPPSPTSNARRTTTRSLYRLLQTPLSLSSQLSYYDTCAIMTTSSLSLLFFILVI